MPSIRDDEEFPDNITNIEISNLENNENIVHNNNELRSPPRVLRDHPSINVIGELNSSVRTRNQLNQMGHVAFLSHIEPKNIKEASTDENWLIAMQEELNQFERNDIWDLVPRPSDQSVIGTKWVFKNKAYEQGNNTRNKAKLVAHRYNQEEGIDYEETFAPVARLEAIRILLAYACFHNFKLYQRMLKVLF